MNTIENITDKEIQSIQDYNEQYMHDIYFDNCSSNNKEYDMINNDFETCTECNKIVSNNPESHRVESTLGVFCNDKCYAKYILLDEQFKEIYPDD